MQVAKKKKDTWLFVILFVVLFLYAALMIGLLCWAFFTSVKSQIEFRNNKIWIPHGHIWQWSWSNIGMVFQHFSMPVFANGTMRTVNFWQMLLYTLLYAGVGAFILTVVPCLVAYVTAKYKFRFNAVIYGIVIVTMALPIVGAAPSEIRMLKLLGMYNTIWGNWIQKLHFLGMYFLVFYAAFKSVPNEYMEAAYVDGAGEYQVLFTIMLPLIRTTFSAVMLIKFIDLWNDYQTPLLYLPSYPTLAVGLYSLGESTSAIMSRVPMRMAACMILMAPILVLFIAFRNQLMGNLTMGGVKE